MNDPAQMLDYSRHQRREMSWLETFAAAFSIATPCISVVLICIGGMYLQDEFVNGDGLSHEKAFAVTGGPALVLCLAACVFDIMYIRSKAHWPAAWWTLLAINTVVVTLLLLCMLDDVVGFFACFKRFVLHLR